MKKRWKRLLWLLLLLPCVAKIFKKKKDLKNWTKLKFHKENCYDTPWWGSNVLTLFTDNKCNGIFGYWPKTTVFIELFYQFVNIVVKHLKNIKALLVATFTIVLMMKQHCRLFIWFIWSYFIWYIYLDPIIQDK